MFFEGPEKKLKISLAPGSPSLRREPRRTWDEVVGAAGAHILSELHGERWDAYLLSESSLFVADDTLTLITCGRTSLVDAAFALLARLPGEPEQLLYERKSEHFPHLQRSAFEDDAARLGALLGEVTTRRFGDGPHHVDLLHHRRSPSSAARDATLEVLMHAPDPRTCASFVPGREARARDVLAPLLDGFDRDDHAFEPQGYSVNGVCADAYATVHVTPEPGGSYVSYETQRPADQLTVADAHALVARLAALFRARSIDVLYFRPSDPPARFTPRPAEYDLVVAEPEGRIVDQSLDFAQLRVRPTPTHADA